MGFTNRLSYKAIQDHKTRPNRFHRRTFSWLALAASISVGCGRMPRNSLAASSPKTPIAKAVSRTPLTPMASGTPQLACNAHSAFMRTWQPSCTIARSKWRKTCALCMSWQARVVDQSRRIGSRGFYSAVRAMLGG